MEAVQARLDPVAAERYAIEYQCHVQDLGWLAWTRDGGTCGTTGRSLRMEAIRMRIVERTSTPEPTATPTSTPTTPAPTATATPTPTATPGSPTGVELSGLNSGSAAPAPINAWLFVALALATLTGAAALLRRRSMR